MIRLRSLGRDDVLPGDQGMRQSTTTDSRHAWILTHNSGAFHRTSPLTAVPQFKPLGSPAEFSLEQNYPNPFNPKTVISYQLSVNSFVTLKIYDLLGKELVTLVSKEMTPGAHEVEFDAEKYKLGSGTFFYVLKTDKGTTSSKMLYVK